MEWSLIPFHGLHIQLRKAATKTYFLAKLPIFQTETDLITFTPALCAGALYNNSPRVQWRSVSVKYRQGCYPGTTLQAHRVLPGCKKECSQAVSAWREGSVCFVRPRRPGYVLLAAGQYSVGCKLGCFAETWHNLYPFDAYAEPQTVGTQHPKYLSHSVVY